MGSEKASVSASEEDFAMNIQLQNITKSYNENVVFKDYSLTLYPGKCHVLMGPSGCGKTTLLRLMMGLEKPDCGSIRGIPEHISSVFQEDRLCEEFSAIENVALVLKPENQMKKSPRSFPWIHNKKRSSRSEIVQHLNEIGLHENLNQPVREFSGGMKRRVAIVRAVMAQSDMLFLDEPFKGLDSATKELALAYFLAHTQGKTSLVVTHEDAEAQRLNGIRILL
jgi:NitT/TauT family transport system ATP-binding protein